MNQSLCSVEVVKARIESGAGLLLAGDEALLGQLPPGNWIGGTIPYFLDKDGGTFDRDRIFVTELPGDVESVSIRVYNKKTLDTVFTDAPSNGFSFIIIPGMSDVHLSFSLNAPHFPGFATKPLVGWISGIDLDDLGRVSPKVVEGTSTELWEDKAVVMHVALPEKKIADVGIINIFKPGAGDLLQFPESGFTVNNLMVNGEKRNFVDYINEKQLDTKLPLVASWGGALVNISVQKVDTETRTVTLYAPVFGGVDYRWAEPMTDYVSAFTAEVPDALDGTVVFSCNCILNYLYSELEGKQTGQFVGPVTFGEIAYQLLNQTLVYLQIIDTER